VDLKESPSPVDLKESPSPVIQIEHQDLWGLRLKRLREEREEEEGVLREAQNLELSHEGQVAEVEH
jgi:hypothetical protein